jgi:hypothetical protein
MSSAIRFSAQFCEKRSRQNRALWNNEWHVTVEKERCSKVDQLNSLAETEKKTVCVLDSEMWSRSVENSPLNSRAWVLQEYWS